MNNIIPLIARVFISIMFLHAGIDHAKGFDSLVKDLADKHIAMPQFFAAGAVAFLLIGSVMVLTGFKAKVGALMLLIFLVPTTLLYHWNFSDQMQTGFLLSNTAQAGGLLIVIAYGSGGISLDNLIKREPQI